MSWSEQLAIKGEQAKENAILAFSIEVAEVLQSKPDFEDAKLELSRELYAVFPESDAETIIKYAERMSLCAKPLNWSERR